MYKKSKEKGRLSWGALADPDVVHSTVPQTYFVESWSDNTVIKLHAISTQSNPDSVTINSIT